jgi:hypothetical protein
MKSMKNTAMRILAVFAASALAAIGAGSIFNVNATVAASMAGLLAVAGVVAELANAFLTDGKLSEKEINDAFSKAKTK